MNLAEKLVEKGWGNIKDILKDLPGGEYDYPPDESEIISTKNDKQFIYAYLNEPDTSMHEYGVTSNEAKKLINKINDNVETLIYRITKGTGVSGLCGITSHRDIYYRPLIEISREKIENYCKNNMLSPNYDSSNDDIIHNRNLITAAK